GRPVQGVTSLSARSGRKQIRSRSRGVVGVLGLRQRSVRLGAFVVAALALSSCVPITRFPLPAKPAAHASTPAPAPRPINGQNVGVSLYGSVLAWSPQDLARDLDRVRAMNATWVRIPFNWVTLELQGPGNYNWAPADRIVSAAAARHLR